MKKLRILDSKALSNMKQIVRKYFRDAKIVSREAENYSEKESNF